MSNPSIISNLYLTSQEQNLIGGSSKGDLGNPNTYYVPEGILKGRMSAEEVQNERREVGIMFSGVASMVLGVSEGPLVLRLKEIDLLTGETKEDPEVVGVWDAKSERIIRESESDMLTEQMYRKWKETSDYKFLFLREPWKSRIEGTPNSSEIRG